MAQGTITKLFHEKGYCFVEGERGYWFFNQSTLDGTSIDSLQVGQAVEFEKGFGPGGPRADSVKLV